MDQLMLVHFESHFNWSTLIGGAAESLLHRWHAGVRLSHYLLCDVYALVQGSIETAYYAGVMTNNYASFIGKLVVMILLAAGSFYLANLAFGALILIGDLAFFHFVAFVLEEVGLQLQQCLLGYWITCLILPLRNEVSKWIHDLLFFSIGVRDQVLIFWNSIPALLDRLVAFYHSTYKTEYDRLYYLGNRLLDQYFDD